MGCSGSHSQLCCDPEGISESNKLFVIFSDQRLSQIFKSSSEKNFDSKFKITHAIPWPGLPACSLLPEKLLFILQKPSRLLLLFETFSSSTRFTLRLNRVYSLVALFTPSNLYQ